MAKFDRDLFIENEEMNRIAQSLYKKITNRGNYFNQAARYSLGKSIMSMLQHAYGLGRADEANKKFATWNRKFSDNGWMDNTCSCCGFNINEDVHVLVDYDFCPGCGSPMMNPDK